MMDETMKDRAQDFILQWLSNNPPAVDVLNADFIDGFTSYVGCKFKVTNWGANKCEYASKMLTNLYSCGILDRSVINLGGNWQPGFPRWVYAYTVRN